MDLLPIQYWKMSEAVLPSVIDSMNERVNFDLEKYEISLEEFIRYNEVLRDESLLLEIIDFSKAFLNVFGKSISGKGLELGAGVGYLSSVLSSEKEVEKLFVLEYAAQYAEKIMPIVFQHYAQYLHKLQRVVGDFNRLEMDDESLDFIYEIDSLHHSENLSKTLNECYRVLRPGGFLFAIDRGWPDKTSDETLERSLNRELNPLLKERYGLDSSKSITRKDWGEHEIRIKDWMAAFNSAGFTSHYIEQWHPPFLNRVWKKILTPSLMVKRARSEFLMGSYRHKMYGYYNKVVFICFKPD